MSHQGCVAILYYQFVSREWLLKMQMRETNTALSGSTRTMTLLYCATWITANSDRLGRQNRQNVVELEAWSGRKRGIRNEKRTVQAGETAWNFTA